LKTRLSIAAVVFYLVANLRAQQPWQEITVPSVREAASAFNTPPREYGAIQPFVGWYGGDANERMARIVQDLDKLAANGCFVFNLATGNGPPKYLSQEHMDQVKFVVQEAARRGMKLWIQDESDYPSGLAGGLINTEYPQLRMQAIVADIRVSVTAGQTLTMPLPPGTLGAFWIKGSDQSTGVIPLPDGGPLEWIAPSEGSDPNLPNWTWTVVFVRHIYRSSPTRANNRPDGIKPKDARYSLIDYLDPEATRAFMKLTHETYKKAIGSEFGKTVLGFFGDETDYNGIIPWTPRLLEEFQKGKGYDLKPYIPYFFMGKLAGEAQRAYADYYDVWSGMFRDGFFDVEAEWAARNHMEDLRHVGASSVPLYLVRNEGDFFRDMRHVQVPGIDNIDRIGPGIAANFPKIASSAAHLFGRPRAWEEEGGGPGELGKFTADYNFVRGVASLQIRVATLSGGGRGSRGGALPLLSPQGSAIAWYVNRLGYLLSIGRPKAQVAMYRTTNSVWMGDVDTVDATERLAQQLLEHQVDFDYIDEQALTTVGTLDGGGLKNLSGQVYRGIVIPSSSVITRAALDRLRAFATQGGRVIFVGRTPTMVVGRTFLNAAEKAPDLSFAVLEPSAEITPRVLQALPKPDLALDRPCPPISYNHRSLLDADVYFLFNESGDSQSRIVTLAGGGDPQVWDAATGAIHPLAGVPAGDGVVAIPLSFEPYEAKLIVLGPLPAEAAEPEPAVAADQTILELSGDWSLAVGDKSLVTPLKSLEALGIPSFRGVAHYRKEFTAPPATGRVFLECENVRDYAKVRLNGVDLGDHAWRPYRWEITDALKPGTNVLEIEVESSGGRSARAGATPPPAVGVGTANIPVRRFIPGPVVSGLLPAVRLVGFRQR
jgi:hypothetical protein